jgi:hypothetical protein
MTAQKKIHDTPAARQAAHRERLKDRGIRRVEITLPDALADKLKRLAQADAVSPSIIIERLLSDLPDPA